ncbi:MAG: CcdB family protein [Rhodocyclaceae bacterium]|nr:CcdB family protein [Rhodocyclaceae bacterium]
MSRFNVYPNPSGHGYLIDIQADLMAHFNTRVVVPLLPLEMAPKAAKMLNPLFDIDGKLHVMATQFMAAVPVSELKSATFNASNRQNEIVAAIDLLHQGF